MCIIKLIWDYKVSKHFHIDVGNSSTFVSAALPKDKFIVTSSNPCVVTLLDFNTGTYISHVLDIIDLKANENIFVASTNSIFIFSAQLDIIHILQIDHLTKITIQNNELISGRRSDIHFWNRPVRYTIYKTKDNFFYGNYN